MREAIIVKLLGTNVRDAGFTADSIALLIYDFAWTLIRKEQRRENARSLGLLPFVNKRQYVLLGMSIN